MECKSIQKKLSAYIDDILSPQEKMMVDEHLRTCPACASALSDLKKTVGLIKNLEEVEPPAWMTQKIMARIRAEAQPKKGLLQRLFYPLYIKLPVGAIATVVVALTTLYVFRTIEPEVKLAKAPTEETAPQVPSKYVTPPTTPSPAPSKLAEQLFVSKEADAKADKLTGSGVQEIERKEKAEVPATAKKLEQAPAVGALAKGEAQQSVRAAAPRTKLSYMEKQQEKALTFTVFVNDTETAAKEIERTLKELEGKAISAEFVEGKKVIMAAMNISKMHQFLEKLKVIGNVSEKEVGIKGQEGDVTLRIEITKNP